MLIRWKNFSTYKVLTWLLLLPKRPHATLKDWQCNNTSSRRWNIPASSWKNSRQVKPTRTSYLALSARRETRVAIAALLTFSLVARKTRRASMHLQPQRSKRPSSVTEDLTQASVWREDPTIITFEKNQLRWDLECLESSAEVWHFN